MTAQRKPISNIEVIGAFGINDQLEYVKIGSNFEFFPVITENRIRALNEQLPSLATGYDGSLMIENFDDYKKVRTDHFFRWMVHEGGWPWTSPPNIVGTNGSFAEVLATPYLSSGWTGYATLYKGTIYFICVPDKDGPPTENRLPEYCGESFKRLLQGVQTRNAREKVFVVQRTHFANSDLMLLTEIHGRKSSNAGEPVSFIDVKQVSTHLPISEFKNRCLRWWSRAVLGSMDEVIVGRRGRSNHLESIEVLKVDNLSGQSGHCWEPNLCFRFLDYVLKFLVKTAKLDDPRVTYVIRRERDQGFNLKLEGIKSTEEVNLVPTWFVELNERKARAASS